jgi:hypothetical protein
MTNFFNKIFLLTLILSGSIISFSTNIHNNKPRSSYWELSWARQMCKEYPELKLLLASTYQFSPEEVKYNTTQSWSEQLNGIKCPEFDKTLTSIVNLHLIFDGSYKSYKDFVSQQKTNRLSFQNFQFLHKIAINLKERDPEVLKRIERILVIHDAGKNNAIRQRAKQFDIQEPDVHLFLKEVLQICPKIVPTYYALSEEDKLLMRRIDVFHFGHIAHVEGGAEMLQALKTSALLDCTHTLKLRFMIDICEISAYLGHVDNRGSLSLDNHTFQIIEMVICAIEHLKTHTIEESFRYYLNKRAKILGLTLDEQTAILIKIACLMRILDPVEAKIILETLSTLSIESLKKIQVALSPLILRNERTPTYVPAFLLNLFTAVKESMPAKDALTYTIKYGIPFVARVQEDFRYRMKGKSASVTLTYNVAAIQIKTNPHKIENTQFEITPTGEVLLKD